MNTEQELLKTIQLGIEAEAFLSTDTGKYLVERANEELQAAQASLMDINPSDYAGIALLQAKAYQALNFKQWLLEALSDASYAEQQLSEND
jgi:hypothetical protein